MKLTVLVYTADLNYVVYTVYNEIHGMLNQQGSLLTINNRQLVAVEIQFFLKNLL
jgi:hypothetical protein